MSLLACTDLSWHMASCSQMGSRMVNQVPSFLEFFALAARRLNTNHVSFSSWNMFLPFHDFHFSFCPNVVVMSVYSKDTPNWCGWQWRISKYKWNRMENSIWDVSNILIFFSSTIRLGSSNITCQSHKTQSLAITYQGSLQQVMVPAFSGRLIGLG